MLYFLLSTLVLTLYIDVVLSLSIKERGLMVLVLLYMMLLGTMKSLNEIEGTEVKIGGTLIGPWEI